jgi:hypothetical protein
VFDAESSAGIADVVVIVEGTGFGTVTNEAGLFRFTTLPPGEYRLVFQHVAYGEVHDQLSLRPGADLTLRINLSPSAIELGPLVVEAQRSDELEDRARGTSNNVVTREQIEPMIGTGQSLDQVLARYVTGVVIRQPQTTAGTEVCVEFRAPRSIRDPLGCKAPTVFLDGVRIINPGPMWHTFPIEQIERLEVVPSVQAGARFGTDSSYGVLLIETRTGRNVTGVDDVTAGRRATYDWGLESEPYPWFKVFASSFVGNALGLAAGAAIGNGCFQFEQGLSNSHFFLESSCNRLQTAGAATALFGLPVTGAAFGANRAGRTDLSQGKVLPTAVAAALAIVPGYILVVAKQDESFGGSKFIGWGILTVGTPIFTTIADRLFRKYRSNPLDPITDMRR